MSYGLITPEQLRLRLDIGETPVMIDVRQPEEHQEIHIPNSILIPLDTLPSRIEELEHFKEHEIILYWKSMRVSLCTRIQCSELGWWHA